MSATANILRLVRELGEGQWAGQVCPFCEASDKAFSINISSPLVEYKCHRDKCGKGGRLVLGGGAIPTSSNATSPVKHPVLIALSEEQEEWLDHEWGFKERHLRKSGVMFCPTNQRLSLPIYSTNGKVVGHNFRSMQKGTNPKAYVTMYGKDDPCMSYYHTDNRCIIVEDQASAVRASMYCSAIALMGTHISVSKLRAIQSKKFSKVVLCLDRDAMAKATEISRKYSDYFGRFEVYCPEVDLKNMDEDRLCEVLQVMN